ncbi:hypothetical protein [Catellatospora tritici]|nr:hypothetical protein [Catellatospora tritici]
MSWRYPPRADVAGMSKKNLPLLRCPVVANSTDGRAGPSASVLV